MQTKAQTAPPSDAQKKIVEARKEQLAKIYQAKAARAKDTATANKQREEILKSALPKELQTAFENIGKLNEKQLKGFTRKSPTVKLATDGPAAAQSKTAPAHRPHDKKVHSVLNPIFVMGWINNNNSAAFATWDPSWVWLDMNESTSGWWGGGNDQITIYWLFEYVPGDAHIGVEYSLNTNVISGYYTLDDGGWGSGASASINISMDIEQDSATLPGLSQTVWSQNSNGGQYSSPTGINAYFTVSCSNTPPSSDPVFIWVEETFDINVDSGWDNHASAAFIFNEGGNFISEPTLTVTNAPV